MIDDAMIAQGRDVQDPTTPQDSKTMDRSTLRWAKPKQLQEYFDSLVNKLKTQGIGHHDAEDQAMAAFCKGLDKTNLLEPEAWLFTTSIRSAYTLGRQKQTVAKHRQALGYHATRLGEQVINSPVAEAERREEAEIMAKMMHEALATLNALDRTLLDESVNKYSTYQELAEWFGLTHAAIKGRIRRAKDRLRRYFEQRLHSPGNDAG